MLVRVVRFSAAMLIAGVCAVAAAPVDGIVTVRSAYPIDETVDRLKQDIAGKGIKFFDEIDQSRLAADAHVKLLPSKLLVFGNPALGSLFITSNPAAGLDWPVRVLVYEDASGEVWVLYTDFTWIAHRHGIADRDDAFNMAAEVIGSITGSIRRK